MMRWAGSRPTPWRKINSCGLAWLISTIQLSSRIIQFSFACQVLGPLLSGKEGRLGYGMGMYSTEGRRVVAWGYRFMIW